MASLCALIHFWAVCFSLSFVSTGLLLAGLFASIKSGCSHMCITNVEMNHSERTSCLDSVDRSGSMALTLSLHQLELAKYQKHKYVHMYVHICYLQLS